MTTSAAAAAGAATTTSSRATPYAFDAIVVTSASPVQAQAYTLELEARRRLGFFPEHVLLVAVPDPAGFRVGSGGATLNALAVAGQRLCAQAGYPDINPAYLRNKRILILHSGGDAQRIPIFSVRGKAFSALPATTADAQHAYAPVDFLIEQLGAIFARAPTGGCVIAATDVMLLMPTSFQWSNAHAEGVTGIGVKAHKTLGVGHGVYVCAPDVMRAAPHTIDQVPATNILQKASVAELEAAGAVLPDDSIMIDSGVVYMSSKATLDFLALHTVSPLDSCTDTGLDGGSIPFRFELYTDLLMIMNPSMSREAYLDMPMPSRDCDPHRVRNGRKLLWKQLHGLSCFVLYSQDSTFAHLGTVQEYLAYLNDPDSEFRARFRLQRQVRSYAEYPELSKEGTLVNSILAGHGRVESGAFVENSYLRGSFHVDRASLVSGVRTLAGLRTAPHMVVQEVVLSAARVRADKRITHLLPSRPDGVREQPYFVAPPPSDSSKIFDDARDSRHGPDTMLRVVVIFGVFDQIKEAYTSKKATLCNRPWSHYLPASSFPASSASASGATSADNPEKHTLTSFAHLLLDPELDEIWPAHVPERTRTLWNARIFPILLGDQSAESIMWMQYAEAPSVQTLCEWKQSTRVSLEDILALADAPQEFYWRARASFLVDQKELESILLERRARPLAPIIARCQPEYKPELLARLDSIAASSPLDVCARALCTIADVLASLPGATAFARSGPARNPQWLPILNKLATVRNAQQQREIVRELTAMRNNWLKVGSPQLFIRAARHYDGAWSALTRHGVSTVWQLNFAHTESPTPLLVGQSVETTAPARLDLMGGWSDTPPISFERGGKVVMVAVNVNDVHPCGATAKVFLLPPEADTYVIVQTGKVSSRPLDESLVLSSPSRIRALEDDDQTVVLHKLSDVSDYNDPGAPAALVKAVLVALGIVDLASPLSLAEQLQRAVHPKSFATAANAAGGAGDAAAATPLKVGFYIRSWCGLPQGTGLGVSSILAACIVNSVARIVARQYSPQHLVHVVLMVEQLLTTGGGWQDQIGGIYPGFKLGSSADRLPLLVDIFPIDVPHAVVRAFDEHTLLVHTGQSRLAKNLLQTVLRRWYQRDETVVRVIDGLVSGAEQLREALLRGDIADVGRLLLQYWEYKRTLATPVQSTTHKQAYAEPAEPKHITRLIQRLLPLTHGHSLLGAGGGGFLLIVTKRPVSECLGEVQTVLSELNAEAKTHAQEVVAVAAAAVEQQQQQQQQESKVEQQQQQTGVPASGAPSAAATVPAAFAFDEWPIGDYVVYRPSVCLEGMKTRVLA